MCCPKCGAQIEEGAKRCSDCGAPVGEHSKEQQAKKKHKHRFAIIVCAMMTAGVVIVGVILIIYGGWNQKSSGSDGPKYATEKCFNALYSFDYDTLSQYYALDVGSTMIKLIEYESATPLSDSAVNQLLSAKYETPVIKTIFEGALKTSGLQQIKDQLGADATITVYITETTDLTQSQMDSAISNMNLSFGLYGVDLNSSISLSNIQTMCEVRGNIIMRGRINAETDNFDVYCLNIGGEWKVLDTSDSLTSSSHFLTPFFLLEGLVRYFIITNG